MQVGHVGGFAVRHPTTGTQPLVPKRGQFEAIIVFRNKRCLPVPRIINSCGSAILPLGKMIL